MRRILILFLSLLFIQCTSEKYSEKDFYSEATLKSEREKFFDKSINQTITQSLLLPLNNSTEQKYISAFWAMEIIQYKNEFTDSVINSCFDNLNERSTEFQRSFLELVYTLYQNKYTYQVEVFAKETKNPKLFAMCLDYLKRSTYDMNKMLEEFLERNPLLIDHPIMIMLKHSLSNASISLPPIEDLFGNRFEEKLVIFSIQRSSRDYPGLVIIKRHDGKFLRDEYGEIFSIPQLARAITDLPGYITNGNTPEGILSIQGKDVSKNLFIGPSPNIQLVLPFEVNTKIYFHKDVNDTIWAEEYYRNLLPDSWKEYMPIYEAYYAGKAGRNEIIAHGTTIDPEFYKNKPYYPFTPSLGCLMTKEIWSGENGKLVESGQIKLMNALSSIEFEKGYFVVVNIDDTYSPVTLNEIKDLILKAEK
jgi:hypothetical protein